MSAAMKAMDAFSGDISGAAYAPGSSSNYSSSLTINVPVSAETIRQYPHAEEYANKVGDTLGPRVEAELNRRGFGVTANA